MTSYNHQAYYRPEILKQQKAKKRKEIIEGLVIGLVVTLFLTLASIFILDMVLDELEQPYRSYSEGIE